MSIERHRLARWIVTLVVTGTRLRIPSNATGLPGGSYVPVTGTAPISFECHRLARWIVMSLTTSRTDSETTSNPPAGPVDCYVPRYRDRLRIPSNATGLPGGLLRSSLQGLTPNTVECHRLARWIVTFLATGPTPNTVECHRLARWIVTFLATGTDSEYRQCHRLARWILTFLATGD